MWFALEACCALANPSRKPKRSSSLALVAAAPTVTIAIWCGYLSFVMAKRQVVGNAVIAASSALTSWLCGFMQYRVAKFLRSQRKLRGGLRRYKEICMFAASIASVLFGILPFVRRDSLYKGFPWRKVVEKVSNGLKARGDI